jgi:hypothetical protein
MEIVFALVTLSVADPECSRIQIFPSRIQGQKDFGSRIRIRIKEFKYFYLFCKRSRTDTELRKKSGCFAQKLFLGSRKYDPECSSRIRILIFHTSLSKRHRIQIRNTGYPIRSIGNCLKLTIECGLKIRSVENIRTAVLFPQLVLFWEPVNKPVWCQQLFTS